MSQKPATDKYVQFRGEPRALVSHGSSLVFVTVHPEGQPTALYRLGLEDARLAADPLPAGGVALALANNRLFIAGSEGQLSWAPIEAGEPKPLGSPLEPAPTALVCVGAGEQVQLAALCDEELVLVSARTGAELQRIMLGAKGSALAVDPSGAWLAVGLRDGTLRIFERALEESRPADEARLKHSSSGKIHQGEITALLFELGAELRVLSTGVDKKILVTHARGALEPENRSGKSEHDHPILGMIHGTEGRFYTAGHDAAIKAWPGTSGQKRPYTFRDKVGKVVALTMTDYRGRVHLAAACADSTLRVFSLEEGKPQERVSIVHGAYGWAVKTLRRKDPAIREGVLKTLARFNDAQAIELLGNQARVDEDHGLKVTATELLGNSQNPRAIKELESLLKAPEEAVRVAAFAGMRALEGTSSLRPIELALQVGRRDVGVQAVAALSERAEIDELAMDRLVKALDDEPREVRTAALVALERLHDEDSPEADILSLRSARADVRELALVRLWQRELIGRAEVAAALRRYSADSSAEVRQTAFLISLLRRPTLARALRARDKQIHRQLNELLRAPDPSREPAPGEDEGEGPAPLPPEPEPVALEEVLEEDRLPLLEAMSSRARDTCLAGAKGLALLEDARALGTLLQLSREEVASVRVETCRALEALGDPRGAGRLRLLLRDGDASVRDAAFTALARLERAQPLVVAEAGLIAEHEDVRRRGLELVVGLLKRRRAASRRGSSSGSTSAAGEVEEIEEIEEIEEVEEVETLDLESLDGIAGLEAEAAAALEGVEGGNQTPDTPALRLLERALGDAAQVVRREAFKAVLNLEVRGGGARSLRFALRSIHADIRREVLTEVTAQISESWAWPLLLELFEDADPGVRGEAFKFAMKRTKGVGLEPLSAALKGRYSDLRIEATKILGKRKAEGIRALLSTAVDDQDETVRQLAVDALLVNEAEDALKEAMRSAYPDVSVRAAEARAKHGDLGAEKPLLAILGEPEPEIPALRVKWTERVLRALGGLAELGKPDARRQVSALLQHKDANIRRKAAIALAWMARPDALAELQDALSHSDKVVQREAALGLAYCGDPSGASIVFSANDRDIPAMTRMLAALALGAQADDVFMSFLDSREERVRDRALLLLLLNELCENDGIPDRCLATLASAHPRIRLVAAQALERFNDSEEFAGFVRDQFNRRGDNKPGWTIEREVVESLGELIAHGDVLGNPQIKVRAARLLDALEAEKQETFDREWGVFSRRFANTLAERQAVASLRARAELVYASAELRQIVFGAYTGLSRLPGGGAETRIRQTAISRLVEIAQEDDARRGAVTSVLRLALVDEHAMIRKLAFESLQSLGMEGASLATEALASGHRDCGALGLKLLSSLGSASAGLAVLEDVLVQHTDGLEHEAAKLLAELRSVEKGDPGAGLSGEDAAAARERARKAALVLVHARALVARSESMRDESVRGLAGAYEEDGQGPAAEGLRKALRSRFRKVRFAAAGQLAQRGDAACFEVLVEMLGANDRREQREAIERLQRLGDGRAPAAFMDRVDNDPAGTALVDDLLKAAGGFRQVDDAPRLLRFFEQPAHRRAAWAALWTISGHDQPIEDPEDKGTGEWEQRQHPRHDDVLASMLRAGYRLGEDRLLQQVMPAARWSRRSSVNQALATLCEFSRPEVRHAAVEALGWRVRQRGAEVDALLGALRSGDPVTQFLAAEGLALAGYGEGVTVLLTCIDLLPDLEQRRRAVAALGELADPRALDPLLRLVTDDGHALQEQSAEALGHMGKAAPDKAERVFGILSRLSKGTGGVARQALTGLRWFGTRDAWALIRERARDPDWQIRQRVAELLEFNDKPSTRALLVDRLKHEGYFRVARALATSFRKLSGEASLEPDYVFLQSPVRNLEPNTVERLRERGDPGRILELLSQLTQEEHRGVLVASLMSRDPLPVDEAAEQLDSAHEGTAGVAAQILGHAGRRVASAHGRRLEAFAQEMRFSWERELKLAREGKQHRLAELDRPLRQMLWACGRVGVAGSELVEGSRLGGDDPRGRGVRRAAVLALASNAGGTKGRDRLAEVTVGPDAELRTIAAAGLAAHAPGRAATLVDKILDDRASLTRLLSSDKTISSARVHRALGTAVASVHYQGVALPHLVERGELGELIAVLADGDQVESARLGAIEGLARIASDASLEWLANFASSADDEDEELRKAAWRAIRRAKRRRAQASEARERHYRWEVEV